MTVRLTANANFQEWKTESSFLLTLGSTNDWYECNVFWSARQIA